MINNVLKNTFGQCYLVELEEPFERLEIQFVPESIPWERRPYIAMIPIFGRNHPLYHLTGGEENLTLNLQFFADDFLRNTVLEKVRWLNSLSYRGFSATPARKIKLIWGDVFRNEVWIIHRCQHNLERFSALHKFKPMQATVQLNLMLDPDTNLSFEDARNFRSGGNPQ